VTRPVGGSRPVGPRRLPADPRLHLLKRARGVRVYLVDGELVREAYVDFTMGGTDARYAFIPRGEAWVEACLSPRDRDMTVRHELAERPLMLRGATYGDAHEVACRVERAARRARPLTRSMRRSP